MPGTPSLERGAVPRVTKRAAEVSEGRRRLFMPVGEPGDDAGSDRRRVRHTRALLPRARWHLGRPGDGICWAQSSTPVAAERSDDWRHHGLLEPRPAAADRGTDRQDRAPLGVPDLRRPRRGRGEHTTTHVLRRCQRAESDLEGAGLEAHRRNRRSPCRVRTACRRVLRRGASKPAARSCSSRNGSCLEGGHS